MNTIQKKRLLKLADFLENQADPRKFDLGVFIGDSDEDSERDIVDPRKELRPKEGFCGTVGCAIGHCPLVFPRHAEYKNDGYGWSVGAKDTDASDDETNFHWAGTFFGLTRTEVAYLFDPGFYPGDRQGVKSVANRIRYFVRKDGKSKFCSKMISVFADEVTYEGLKG